MEWPPVTLGRQEIGSGARGAKGGLRSCRSGVGHPSVSEYDYGFACSEVKST